jgi:hypothetical protein
MMSYDPVVRTAGFDRTTGTFAVPERTTAVFVEHRDGTEYEGNQPILAT